MKIKLASMAVAVISAACMVCAGEEGETSSKTTSSLKIAATDIVYDTLYLYKDHGFYTYPELKAYHKKLIVNSSVQVNMTSSILLMIKEEEEHLVPEFTLEDKAQFFIKCLIYPAKNKVIDEVTIIFLPITDAQAREAFPNAFSKNAKGLDSIVPKIPDELPGRKKGIKTYLQKVE